MHVSLGVSKPVSKRQQEQAGGLSQRYVESKEARGYERCPRSCPRSITVGVVFVPDELLGRIVES